MSYPRRRLERAELYRGRRVYVSDIDVFGRVTPDLKYVNCEAPMVGFKYEITPRSILYHEAIGDRDPHDPPLIPTTLCPQQDLHCNYPCCSCAFSYAPADRLLSPVEDLGGGMYRVDGETIIFTYSEFMQPGAVRLVESAIEGVDWELFTRKAITLDQVIIILKQNKIQRHRIPPQLCAELQKYWMLHGELPPNA